MTDMRVPYRTETRVQESLRVSIRLVVTLFEIQTNKQTNKHTYATRACTTNMVVGSTIIGILGNVWFNTLHPSVVVSYESVILVGRHNLSKS